MSTMTAGSLQGMRTETLWASFFGPGTYSADSFIAERGADRIGKEGGVDLWISPEALRRLYPDALQSHPNGLSIQVKSSIAGAIEHLRGGMDRGRIIPVVVGVCPPPELQCT